MSALARNVARRSKAVFSAQLRSPFAEYVRVSVKGLNRNTPVLIYQMGKVGSRTVYDTLSGAGLPYPIYHVHWLSPDGIKEVEERYQNSGSDEMPRHLITSRVLRRKLEKKKEPWYIITLVRDPIARGISEFFELAWAFWPELVDEDGCVRADDAMGVLQILFAEFDESTDRASTWFDRELRSVFAIDVYAHGFDLEHGYSVIRNQEAHVLVLRLENLDRNLAVLGQFLGRKGPVQMVRSNVSAQKKNAETHRVVMDNLRVPESVCARIYSSRYARHFYSDSMRDGFCRKWSRGS